MNWRKEEHFLKALSLLTWVHMVYIQILWDSLLIFCKTTVSLLISAFWCPLCLCPLLTILYTFSDFHPLMVLLPTNYTNPFPGLPVLSPTSQLPLNVNSSRLHFLQIFNVPTEPYVYNMSIYIFLHNYLFIKLFFPLDYEFTVERGVYFVLLNFLNDI